MLPTLARILPRRRWNLLIAGAIVAAVVGVGACSAPTSPSSAAGAPAAQDANSTAASFTAHTLDGRKVTVPGSRPAVLFFFSVECGGCGPSAQALAEAQRSVRDKASFVAVDIAGYETVEDVQGFLTEYDATTLAYAIDTDAKWIRAFGVNQLSTAVVLNAAGKEVFRAVEPTAERVRAELAKVGA